NTRIHSNRNNTSENNALENNVSKIMYQARTKEIAKKLQNLDERNSKYMSLKKTLKEK
ncbi:3096_t:CDS:2, partial [Scutellospora calospora]